MANPEIVVQIKFKSALSFEELQRVADERIESFRALTGLTQKYYYQIPQTGEVGGVYVWETKEDFAAYRASDLRASIAEAYQVTGEPEVQVMEVFRLLRD